MFRRLSLLCVASCSILCDVFSEGLDFGEVELGSVPDYNLKIGEAYFDSTIRSGLGWDSNYDQNSEADASTFYSVGLLTNLLWMPSPRIRFNTNFDLQYLKRAEDTEGRLLVGGGVDDTAASISVAIRSGDRVVRLSAQLSSSFEGLRIEGRQGEQQNASFQALAYSVGASYERALSPYLTSNLAYVFSSQRAIGNESEDEFASLLNASSHNFSTKLEHDLNQSLGLGFFAGTALTERSERRNGGVQTYRTGIEAVYRSSYAVVLGLSVGAEYQENASNYSNSGSAWAPEVVFSANFLKLNNAEHKITASYRRDFSNVVADVGGNQNDLAEFSQTVSLGYQYDLDVTPTWAVSVRQGLSQVEDVNQSGGSCRYYMNVRTGYAITPRWTFNFAYSYTNQFDGGDRGEGFSRHIISSNLSFRL